MHASVDLLDTNVMPIFIITTLDIIITLCFYINCSIVICSPIVLFAFMREVSSETYGLQVYLPLYIFRSIYQKYQKFLAAIYLLLRFSNLLYLYLSDLTFASDREGIDNPFFALGASV